MGKDSVWAWPGLVPPTRGRVHGRGGVVPHIAAGPIRRWGVVARRPVGVRDTAPKPTASSADHSSGSCSPDS